MKRKALLTAMALAVTTSGVAMYSASAMAGSKYCSQGDENCPYGSTVLVTPLTVSDHMGHLVPWDVYYTWVKPSHSKGYWHRSLYEITIYNCYQHYLRNYWGTGAMTYPEFKSQYLSEHGLTHARVVSLHPIVSDYTRYN